MSDWDFGENSKILKKCKIFQFLKILFVLYTFRQFLMFFGRFYQVLVVLCVFWCDSIVFRMKMIVFMIFVAFLICFEYF